MCSAIWCQNPTHDGTPRVVDLVMDDSDQPPRTLLDLLHQHQVQIVRNLDSWMMRQEALFRSIAPEGASVHPQTPRGEVAREGTKLSSEWREDTQNSASASAGGRSLGTSVSTAAQMGGSFNGNTSEIGIHHYSERLDYLVKKQDELIDVLTRGSSTGFSTVPRRATKASVRLTSARRGRASQAFPQTEAPNASRSLGSSVVLPTSLPKPPVMENPVPERPLDMACEKTRTSRSTTMEAGPAFSIQSVGRLESVPQDSTMDHSRSSAQCEKQSVSTGNEKLTERLKALRTGTLSATEDEKEKQRLEAARSHAQSINNIKSTSSLTTEREASCRRLLRDVVRSNKFEAIFAVLIVSNSFFVGVQVEYSISNRTSRTPIVFYVIQHVFAGAFVLELVLRVAAEGKSFFLASRQWMWNYLDVFIVFTSIFEVIMDSIYLANGGDQTDSTAIEGSSNVRIIRILRIARLMRIIRVARILRFIHALRTFIYSIVATMKSLVWALLLLCMILYVFGILMAQTAGDWLIDVERADSPQPLEAKSIRRYWGTLPRAMFTLFKSISNGISWDVAVHPLSELGGQWVGVFTCFISFTYFAVLNVVTGIFCQSAIETAQQNEDLMVQAQIAQRELYVKRIQRLFQDIDEDGSGIVTLHELESRINDDAVQAVFASMDIDTSDAWMLFKLLDSDEGNELDIEEFVMGLMKLKGNAKRADLVEIQAGLRKLTLANVDLLHKLEGLEYQHIELSQDIMRSQDLNSFRPVTSLQNDRNDPPAVAKDYHIEKEFEEGGLAEFFASRPHIVGRPAPTQGDTQPVNPSG